MQRICDIRRRLAGLVASAGAGLGNLLPRYCLLCRDRISSGYLCRPCCEDLPRIRSCCPRCGACQSSVRVCGECLRRPPHFDLTLAPFRYAPPIDHWIKQLKYQGKLYHAHNLGRLLADELLRRGAALPDLIVPVPLHAAKLRRRGFNQALEIARPLSRALDRPLETRAVFRPRRTRSQADLVLAERRANMRAAFAVKWQLRGQRLAIVDDVMTSGETARALAACLRLAGAAHIQNWVVARA